MGTAVYGLDGSPVGTLEFAGEECIGVRRPDGGQCLVRGDAIHRVEEGAIYLICYASGVHRWLWEGEVA